MNARRPHINILLILLLCLSILPDTSAQTVHSTIGSQPYRWKNVPIVGGGFVDGIIFHPRVRNIRYCRTDMGGAYRWNDKAKEWEPLLDFLSYEDRNLMGVESIAVDPNDPGFVIIACGTYTNARTGNGAILRSFDRGKTFQRTDVPFKFGGNENGRGNGERMMVDPKNGNIIYLGTRLNGLWKSLDKGKTWSQVNSFPDVTETVTAPGPDSMQQRRFQLQNRGAGIVITLFDSRNRATHFSTVYAFASLTGRNNLFRSEDGAETWNAVPGQPTQYRPTHAVLSEDGILYITYGNNPGPYTMTNGAVWKLNTKNGEWTEITPDKPDPTKKREFGYAAVAVDPKHPQTLLVTTFNRYMAGGEEIFRSRDAGNTWKQVLRQSKFDHSLAPYVARTGVHWMFDIEIDPFDSNHALFTTGYGGHETFNLTDLDKNKPVTWSIMSKGIEETVALDLLSPSKGAPLISAIGDYGGFVHWDLNKTAEGNFTNPHFGNTDGLACAENNPGLMVRVGITSNSTQGKNIGFTLDGGKNWQPAANMPAENAQHGHIAVSSNGDNWIWTPQRSAVFVTQDHGETWVQAKGIPNNVRVIADRVNPKKFYALFLYEGKIFLSSDGGNSFEEHALGKNIHIPARGSIRGDIRGGQDRIYATPGKEEDLWIAAFDGLYHSIDGGKSFLSIPAITEIHGFGFGKAAPTSPDPSLYLTGVINGIRGIFRSDNTAGSWTRINDAQHQWGLLLQITGDPKKWGRVYVGTHGRGILYGDPVK